MYVCEETVGVLDDGRYEFEADNGGYAATVGKEMCISLGNMKQVEC
jgi:hypothetical protein